MATTANNRRRTRLRNSRPTGPSTPAGFTMVEMLVAVTLVLIMMMMFAEVFEIASGMHHRVRGLARNDQRARIMQNIIDSDISKRTFRHMVPFAQNETGYGRDQRLGERQGYVYISENNPNDDSDDVLQLTIR
ncbi:MAG: prepilin-type N-terminal cleavage/methylation domain-containing protein, partial [Planctomycetaceae bacterium]